MFAAPKTASVAYRRKKTYTKRDNGLLAPWHGLVFCNPPWSEQKRAVVPWLRKFIAHPGGGIFLCVARTSCDWFHELVLPNADLLCFPTGKTRFIRPDGNPGPAPTNGIALIGKTEVACEALRRSGLGHCLTVDLTAAPPIRRTRVGLIRKRDQLALPLVAE
jgi:DNA N-6-adenine-methyltransferase Dam